MKILKAAVLNLRVIKLRRFFGSIFYPMHRDLLNHRSRYHKKLAAIEETGTIVEVNPLPNGRQFQFQHLTLEITFFMPDLVRVDWQPGILPLPYAIARQDWEAVETTLISFDSGWSLSSDVLTVLIQSDGAIAFQTADGQTIREELPPQRQIRVAGKLKSNGWTHRARLRSEEAIYGLGERAAPLNLRDPNRSYRMWNSDHPGKYGSGADPLYLGIPVYLGLHHQGSYLVFYENSFRAMFSFSDVATADFEGGALRYYFTLGSPPHCLNRYTDLTERSPLPPAWALGYHQSRWGYETEVEVRNTVEGFITHDLPLRAIHLDIDCQQNFRAFSIDPDRFPKLREFSQELLERGIHLIAITNPGIRANPTNKLFQEGRTLGLFCTYPNGIPVEAPVWSGSCAFPDFTNPQARHWWSRQYEYLLDLGITGFWHDMNEPAVLVIWGDRTLPVSVTQHSMEGRGGTHLEAHNVYGLLQAEAAYASLRESRPENRPFIVSRSGWAGLQRYAWTWTGDIETTWNGLRQTIPTILGLGLSGIPYSGADIGGFKGNPSAELYLRWLQMSCFLPFCRTHCSDDSKPRTPWGYGEPYLRIAREFLKLRDRLLPYFYNLAQEATETGFPLVRPLFWLDSSDDRLWNIDDAFLLGNQIIVSPIVEENARSRSVFLPRGQWYHFWDHQCFDGEQTIEIKAPLEWIPVFIQSGTILPMQVEQRLELHIYLPIQDTAELLL